MDYPLENRCLMSYLAVGLKPKDFSRLRVNLGYLNDNVSIYKFLSSAVKTMRYRAKVNERLIEVATSLNIATRVI